MSVLRRDLRHPTPLILLVAQSAVRVQSDRLCLLPNGRGRERKISRNVRQSDIRRCGPSEIQ